MTLVAGQEYPRTETEWNRHISSTKNNKSHPIKRFGQTPDSQVPLHIRRPICLAWGGGAREAWNRPFTPTPTARSVGGFENVSKAQASTHPPQARLRQVFDLCFVSVLERSMCARSVGGFENVSKAQASTHPPQARLRQVFDLCFVSVLERSMCMGLFSSA